MAEVFTGGPELILKVTESQIETIFDMIYHCNDINIQARLMMALETLAKIEDFDLPVSRNQHLIIKNFCRLRDSICQEFLGQTVEMEQKRMKILKGSDSDDSPLQLLLGVVNMLAACAVGKDRFIDSVCQNILSIEEVVNIISTDLLPQRKKPFVRFLIFAYLITDDDHPLSQLTALTHGVTMWRYLEHLALILEGVANVLDSLPKRMIDKIRNGLSSKRQASVYMPNRNVKRNKQRLNELRAQKIISVKAVSGVTDDKGELYPDMMEYLAEGVIPLLHSYYSSYFNPSTLAKESDRIKEFNISANITKGLMHLSQDLVKVFSSKKHIKMYQETLSTLLSYDYICETASIDEQQIRKVQRALELAAKRASYGGTLGPSFDGNDNMAGVIEDYNNQKNLNDLFNNYSRNYHICYMGPNTAKHQINSPVTDTIGTLDMCNII
jgi:inositol 1,4,5-triphosphate receptor type 1